MVTGAEVTTVANASRSIVKGIQALTAPSNRWPNVHEALLELYIILDDWCQVAEENNKTIIEWFREELRRNEALFTGGGTSKRAPSVELRLPYNARRNQRVLSSELGSVLEPPIPWALRWRRSSRRAAARQTLRSMMRVYCPDLLSLFDVAVAERLAWTRFLTDDWAAQFADQSTDLELIEMRVLDMQSTLRQLFYVRDQLLDLIQSTYPLGTANP